MPALMIQPDRLEVWDPQEPGGVGQLFTLCRQGAPKGQWTTLLMGNLVWRTEIKNLTPYSPKRVRGENLIHRHVGYCLGLEASN